MFFPYGFYGFSVSSLSPLNSSQELKDYLAYVYMASAQFDNPPDYYVENLCKAIDGAPAGTDIIGRIAAATWQKIDYDPNGTYKAGKNLPASVVLGLNGQALPAQALSESEIIGGGYNNLDESTYSKLNGLTNKIKYDSSKYEFDSY